MKHRQLTCTQYKFAYKIARQAIAKRESFCLEVKTRMGVADTALALVIYESAKKAKVETTIGTDFCELLMSNTYDFKIHDVKRLIKEFYKSSTNYPHTQSYYDRQESRFIQRKINEARHEIQLSLTVLERMLITDEYSNADEHFELTIFGLKQARNRLKLWLETPKTHNEGMI